MFIEKVKEGKNLCRAPEIKTHGKD
jgi:hypothetical protein